MANTIQELFDEFRANVKHQLQSYADARNAIAKDHYDGQLRDFNRNVEQNGSEKGLTKPLPVTLYAPDVETYLHDMIDNNREVTMDDYLKAVGQYPPPGPTPEKPKFGGVGVPVADELPDGTFAVAAGAVVVPGDVYETEDGTIYVAKRYGLFGVSWKKIR